ncbi:MAG: hypothetical protein LLF94_08285 [Chlamydiales bacterium]|nr:hypothetical protein [Chlamydiales bacterium]
MNPIAVIKLQEVQAAPPMLKKQRGRPKVHSMAVAHSFIALDGSLILPAIKSRKNRFRYWRQWARFLRDYYNKKSCKPLQKYIVNQIQESPKPIKFV